MDSDDLKRLQDYEARVNKLRAAHGLGPLPHSSEPGTDYSNTRMTDLQEALNELAPKYGKHPSEFSGKWHTNNRAILDQINKGRDRNGFSGFADTAGLEQLEAAEASRAQAAVKNVNPPPKAPDGPAPTPAEPTTTPSEPPTTHAEERLRPASIADIKRLAADAEFKKAILENNGRFTASREDRKAYEGALRRLGLEVPGGYNGGEFLDLLKYATQEIREQAKLEKEMEDYRKKEDGKGTQGTQNTYDKKLLQTILLDDKVQHALGKRMDAEAYLESVTQEGSRATAEAVELARQKATDADKEYNNAVLGSAKRHGIDVDALDNKGKEQLIEAVNTSVQGTRGIGDGPDSGKDKAAQLIKGALHRFAERHPDAARAVGALASDVIGRASNGEFGIMGQIRGRLNSEDVPAIPDGGFKPMNPSGSSVPRTEYRGK
jgi:hypothetical protein